MELSKKASHVKKVMSGISHDWNRKGTNIDGTAGKGWKALKDLFYQRSRVIDSLLSRDASFWNKNYQGFYVYVSYEVLESWGFDTDNLDGPTHDALSHYECFSDETLSCALYMI